MGAATRVSSCDRYGIRPGDPGRYAVPRPFPEADPQDVTSYHPGQRTWSIDNIPNIFYQLRPCPEWYRFKSSPRPGVKRDQAGRPVQEPFPSGPTPEYLLDFKILPDEIGTAEHWVFFENADNGPTGNALQTHIGRMRKSYVFLAWQAKGRWNIDNPVENAVLASLTRTAIETNSTRGYTPGLIISHMGEDGGRVPHPPPRSGQGLSRPRKPVQNSSTLTGKARARKFTEMDPDPASRKQPAPKRARRTKSHCSLLVNSSSELSSLSSTPSGISDSDLTVTGPARGVANEAFEIIDEEHFNQRFDSPHESPESVTSIPMEAYGDFTVRELVTLCEENGFDEIASAIRHVMNMIWSDQANLVRDSEDTVDTQGQLAYGEATQHLHGAAFSSPLRTDSGNIVDNRGVSGEAHSTTFMEDSLDGAGYSLVQENMASQGSIESLYGDDGLGLGEFLAGAEVPPPRDAH